MRGTWFTGHSVVVYGTYEDQSSILESKHQLKLVAKSPHFNETTIMLHYLFNETILLVDANIEYGVNPYGLVLKHSHASVYEQSIYTQLKILDKLYWMNAKLSNMGSRQLTIDLHFDR